MLMMMMMMMMIMKKNKVIEKKAKGTKKCVIKRRLMLKNYKYCLFNDKTILRSQQRFKSDHHKVSTEEANKIALSSDDDKRLQTFGIITAFPHRTREFKLCENETLNARSAKEKILSKECENKIYVTCNMF